MKKNCFSALLRINKIWRERTLKNIFKNTRFQKSSESKRLFPRKNVRATKPCFFYKGNRDSDKVAISLIPSPNSGIMYTSIRHIPSVPVDGIVVLSSAFQAAAQFVWILCSAPAEPEAGRVFITAGFGPFTFVWQGPGYSAYRQNPRRPSRARADTQSPSPMPTAAG
ncbi:MAG: hypothetical protein KF852_00650 [Saprospiraceae bacterium]|nr:hypothetical protein [Saprospiraceae bacterium]